VSDLEVYMERSLSLFNHKQFQEATAWMGHFQDL